MGEDALHNLDPTLINKISPLPLYYQISGLLRQQIEDGDLKPGDPLPSEFQLIQHFKVSRYVVRQALQDLAQQGLIFTEHGRGSFVSHKPIEKPLDVLQSFHSAMKRSGLPVEVRVMKKELVHPPENIAGQLDLNNEDYTFYLERMAFLEGKPINFMISYIAPGPWEIEKLLDFPGGSLYQFLDENLNIKLIHSRSYIEVVSASELESRGLSVTRGSILMQISSLTYDKFERKVELTRILYPGRRFRFRFDSTIRHDDVGNDHIVLT